MTKEFKPELRQKWIDALKSGRYKQGKSALKNKHGGYCCLGVACDIVDPNGWKCGGFWRYGEMMYMTSPPEDVRRMIGITLSTQGQLILMNDFDGKSFFEIAEYLEGLDPNE